MASKGKYNKHLYMDNPEDHIPKTSKWRRNKRMKHSDERETIKSSESIVNGDESRSEFTAADCESHVRSVEPANMHSSDDPVDGADGDNTNDEAWFSREDSKWFQKDEQEEWFQINEESLWCDDSDYQTPAEEDIQDFSAQFDDMKTSDDSPIYQGASISIAESAILILTFALRHNLTGECLSDLLTLISLHCAATSFLHSSLYRFRTYFNALKSPLIFHKYCVKCETLATKDCQECAICNSDLSVGDASSYFVEIPLLFQLQQFFQRKNFHASLLHRFSRKKKRKGNIEDIYDGELYQKNFRSGGFLSQTNNVSLMWYTDGVPLFKSSKISIWPLFFAINELPVKERFKQENLIFAGLWFGKSKPLMSCFMKPFHDRLDEFRHSGYDIHCAHCASNICVKGLLLCGTCDLPAKCMVMNMTQFNGRYGCPKCKQEGVTTKSGKGHTKTFPFDETSLNEKKRSHCEFIQNGDKAFETGIPVYGVKGPSWWVNICPDIINGTAIDYMHAVLLGIVRKLLQLWFDSKFSSERFSISNLVAVADKKLSQIKPPYYIQRHPRDIKEQSKYWKASECRAWLFFYSIPVLFGLLEKQYFQHYALLVEAVYILNLESISHQDLQHCEEMLLKFTCLFSVLYGDQFMSANLHQMLHLTDTVKQLGPLWVYSCFSFESINGRLVSLFHGTQNPVVQIANCVSTMLKLPVLSAKVSNETKAGLFYTKLSSRNYHYKVRECMFDGGYILGKLHLQTLDIKFITALSQVLDNNAVGDCFVFYRVLLRGELYHSFRYNTHSRNSCTVVYRKNNLNCCGQVVFYCKVYPMCLCPIDHCRCTPSYFALIKQFRQDEKCMFLDTTDIVHAKFVYMFTGDFTELYEAVPITDILGLGIHVKVGEKHSCVLLRPNSVESD